MLLPALPAQSLLTNGTATFLQPVETNIVAAGKEQQKILAGVLRMARYDCADPILYGARASEQDSS